ncbi:cobalt-factor-III C17-methyltransferase [Halobacterium hubeiense]|uniref:Cobalt-factor-III C17-methyltransferase n=1 Tax=Halobacterium hubeiense TaxID=1407499 RepID=A0A0U5H3D9_9EURY|nr:SAM-dependent methyltransferase [Halobacterium hubeiense]CQH59086.1 cobalt-factor-III C17-methyltransferase [Halobacterium hubeiense]
MSSEAERSEASESASSEGPRPSDHSSGQSPREDGATASEDTSTDSDAATAPDTSEYGTLYVVGIGPGLPGGMTQRAKDVVRTADCVVASNLYQEFLRRDGTLPPEDSGERPEQEVVRSTMGRQVELAREAFERVRDGEDVAHVSGGDPNVYGKSDLVYLMAEEDEAYDVPIEIVPGVTAALGGAANLGAPLSNDFCTISLSEKWRGWDEIEEKLRAAAISGFVVVLYNCWRDYERAVQVLREERADDVPVAIINDAGRGDAGRNTDGETHTVTMLGEVADHDEKVGGMGTSILVGNHETEVWENDHREHLVTPRGGRDVEDF